MLPLWAISFECSQTHDRDKYGEEIHTLNSVFLQTDDTQCKLAAGWFNKLIPTIPWKSSERAASADEEWLREFSVRHKNEARKEGANDKDAKRNEPTSPVPAVQSPVCARGSLFPRRSEKVEVGCNCCLNVRARPIFQSPLTLLSLLPAGKVGVAWTLFKGRERKGYCTSLFGEGPSLEKTFSTESVRKGRQRVRGTLSLWRWKDPGENESLPLGIWRGGMAGKGGRGRRGLLKRCVRSPGRHLDKSNRRLQAVTLLISQTGTFFPQSFRSNLCGNS